MSGQELKFRDAYDLVAGFGLSERKAHLRFIDGFGDHAVAVLFPDKLQILHVIQIQRSGMFVQDFQAFLERIISAPFLYNGTLWTSDCKDTLQYFCLFLFVQVKSRLDYFVQFRLFFRLYFNLLNRIFRIVLFAEICPDGKSGTH